MNEVTISQNMLTIILASIIVLETVAVSVYIIPSISNKLGNQKILFL